MFGNIDTLNLKHKVFELYKKMIIFLLIVAVRLWDIILIPLYWKRPAKVLFAGQAYYNAWYLSRALRELGWQADVLNWNGDPNDQIYFHGEDIKFSYDNKEVDLKKQLFFYLKSLFTYRIFHFSNAHGMNFGPLLSEFFSAHDLPDNFEVIFLKKLKKKIVYSNNGCLDGVSQSSFRKWLGPEVVCNSCNWRDVSWVCSDERNLKWGKFRNAAADYQCCIGGNRKDYNHDPRIHEVPEFYCLDPELWNTSIQIPEEYKVDYSADVLKLYHSVGNFKLRTDGSNKNIKSTHIYLPLVERLKKEGYPVELMFIKDEIENKKLIYYQAQADIFLDMLTFGFFGANAREAMMLGKPVICYLRQEWLESMRMEIPEYVEELPIITATPDTVYSVLVELINNPDRRGDVGRRSREFALKWHSADAGGQKFDRIYKKLLWG